MAIPGQSAKLNVHQSVFAVAKSPNLRSAECTTPTVYSGKNFCTQ